MFVIIIVQNCMSYRTKGVVGPFQSKKLAHQHLKEHDWEKKYDQFHKEIYWLKKGCIAPTALVRKLYVKLPFGL